MDKNLSDPDSYTPPSKRQQITSTTTTSTAPPGPSTQSPGPSTPPSGPSTPPPGPTTQPPGPSTPPPGPSTQPPGPSTQSPGPSTPPPGPSTPPPGPSTQPPGPSTQPLGPSTQSPRPSTPPPGPSTPPPGPTTQPPGPSTQPPGPSTQPPGPSTQSPRPSTPPPGPSTQPPGPSTQPPGPSTQSPGPSTPPPRPSTQPPGPSTSPSLLVYHEKVKKILEVCGRQIMYLVLRCSTASKDPDTDFITYMTNLPSNKLDDKLSYYVSIWHNYAHLFDDTMREQMRNDPSGVSFDIPLRIAIIRAVFDKDDYFVTEDEHLESLLTTKKELWDCKVNEQFTMKSLLTIFKELWDCKANEQFTMTEEYFLFEVKLLRHLLLKTVTAAEEKYRDKELNIDFDTEVWNVNDKIDTIFGESECLNEIDEFHIQKRFFREATKQSQLASTTHSSVSSTTTPIPSTTTTTTTPIPSTTTTTPVPSTTTTTTPVPSTTTTTTPPPGNIYNRLKVVMILEVCGRELMHDILCLGTTNKDPQDNFETFLENLPPEFPGKCPQTKKMKHKKWKKLLNFHQKRSILETTGEDFDITLLHILIKLACEKMAGYEDDCWRHNGPHLENLLTQIKNERNQIFHGKLEMTGNTLKAKVKELRTLMVNTLTAAQQRYGFDVSELNDRIKQVNTDIDRLYMEPLHLDEILKYCEKELLDCFLKEANKHLKEVIENEANMDIMNFLAKKVHLNVQSIFTKIKIVDGKSGLISIEYTDILNEVQNGSSKSSKHVIVMEALAGGGKTTLLKLVMEEWRKGGHGSIKGLHHYQLLLPIQCSNSHIKDFTGLLEDLLYPIYNKYSEVVQNLTKKCNVLIVIDGLDEQNNNSKDLITDLLEHYRNSSNITFLCTTRPETLKSFLSKSVLSYYNVTHMELEGIPVNLRTQFVIRYYENIVKYQQSLPSVSSPQATTQPSHNDNINKLKKLMERLKNKEYCRLPLILTIISWVFFFDQGKMNDTTTQTELLFLAHELCREKLLARLVSNNKPKNMGDRKREKNVKSWLLKLYSKALVALYHDQLILSDENDNYLPNECDKLDLPEDDVMAAFLYMKNSQTAIGQIKKQYMPPHKSFQELYASLYVVKTLIDSQQSVSLKGNTIQNIIEDKCGKVDWTKFQNVLQQIAGLMQLEPKSNALDARGQEVVDLLIMSGVSNVEQWHDIVEESKPSKVALHAIAKRFPTADEITIRDTRVLSYSQVLPYLKETNVKVDINIDPTPLTPGLKLHKCYIVVKDVFIKEYSNLLSQLNSAHVKINIMSNPRPLIQSLQQHECNIVVKEAFINEYSRLLSHIKPAQVKVIINGDLCVLGPSLEKHNVEELWLLHSYSHPHPPPTPPDDIINKVLFRSDLRKFAGEPSVSLPDTLTHLRIAVTSDQQASLLPTLHNLKQLKHLYVHVTKKVSSSALSCPLPNVSWVELCVSNVKNHSRAVRIAEPLQPEQRKKGASSLPRKLLVTDHSDEYDTEGYDKDGYDRMGYDKDGYDREGFDMDIYDLDGYDRQGYDKKGYARDGYNPDEYNKRGFDRMGYNRIGYNMQGYDRQGYNRDGYNKEGYDRQGYNKEGYDKEGYDRQGYNKEGYDKEGYDRQGYNKKWYNKEGRCLVEQFKKECERKEGFTRMWHYMEGYDRQGYDRQGYKKDGYNKDGYMRDGYNRDGYNRVGYNRQGYNKHGYDRQGYNKKGYKAAGYDNIYFPWTDLDVNEWEEMLMTMQDKGIKVNNSIYIPPPPSNIMRKDQEARLASLAWNSLGSGFSRDWHGLYKSFEWDLNE